MKNETRSVRLPEAAWLVYLGVGAVVTAAYFGLPIGDTARSVLDVVFALGAVVAIGAGVYFYRPDRRRPWILYGVGMGGFFLHDAMQAYSMVVHGSSKEEAGGNDLFLSAGYVVIIIALVSLVYSRDGGERDKSSLIDASIVVTGATMVTWVFFMAPFAFDASRPLGERIMEMTYPVANLILLAVSVRLAVSRGTRTTAFFLLLMAMLASLIANTLSLDQLREEGFIEATAPLNIIGIAATLFAGAAPLHRSMRSLTEVGHHEGRLTPVRMVLFLVASASGVLIYLVERLRGNEVQVPVLLGGSFLIFLLVLLRLASLAQALRNREERFRALIQNASDAFAILEPNATFRYVSPASQRVVGYAPAALEGRACFDLVHPDYRDAVRSYWADVLGNPGALFEILLRTQRPDGAWQWLQISSTNLISDRSVRGIVSNFHDVTETKEATEALKASEQNSRLLFESSPLPMWVFDQETLEFLAVNDAAVTHYGYSRDEFLTMKITDIRPDDHVGPLLGEVERIRSGGIGVQRSGEWTHRLKDGRLIDVEIVSHSIDFRGRAASLTVAQDVTERKRVEHEKESLQGQLRQSQKLEAVGQLAGGVAHDFNNLLAVVLNYARFVRDDMPEGTPAHEDMTQILNAANKASRLVRQLLTFSRREIVKPEVLDVNSVVADIHKLLARTTRESISLVLDMGEDLWSTVADRGQIEQVLLNLAVNADAAMPDGGTLAIKTINRVIGEDAAAQKAELRAGSYVCLSVSDDGVGMSDETAARVFEPFFTTKGVGEGSGLGLSTVYGIVKQAGGYVYVYSEEGAGTTFNIYLPATDASPLDEDRVHFDLGGHNGHASILVVEDEAGVREITKRILTTAGYDVVVAELPSDALAIINTGRRVDLLLTDVIMPELSGKDLARQVRSLRPGIKVMFMSGYTDEIIARQGVLDEGVMFLQKPFGAEELLPMVTHALGNQPEPVGDPALSVLIVDDEEPMRQVLRMLLEPKFRVVGEASSGPEAVRLAATVRPDLIVLDHQMPGMTGADAAPLLRDACPTSKICAFSAVLDALPPWADAFLTKERIGDLPPVLDALV